MNQNTQKWVIFDIFFYEGIKHERYVRVNSLIAVSCGGKSKNVVILPAEDSVNYVQDCFEMEMTFHHPPILLPVAPIISILFIFFIFFM